MAAIEAPMNGPNIGTHAYFQSLVPLCFNGSKAWTIRGPKSLAGLIAYPVVPPRERPIAQTKNATGIAPRDPRPIGVFASEISPPVK